MKVMTILGTRPEIIRLAACIKALDRYTQHVLVHTGQNWDPMLNDVFFDELELRKPDHNLGVVGADLGETMGNIIALSYKILLAERPDALLVLGDTNSALAAISAKRLKIPIFHMEAGNRCFDQNVPEEINRKIVDHIADINLPYTEHSRRYLLSEGFAKEHIFVTGSPMAEVLAQYQPQIDASEALGELGLTAGRYILVSAHREENIDLPQNFESLVASLNAVAERYQMPVIYSTHPRTKKRIETRGLALNPLIQNLPPFGFFDYNHLQQKAFCVLSDSGTLSEESAMLKFPAVLIRTSTERPEVLDKGSILIGGISPGGMIEAIEAATQMFKEGSILPPDYQDRNVSTKVVKIILSYTKIINKVVWGKG
ncbi:MAG: UDP-N-acetylglucosamine 2-epimerase [Candidatus Lambdaproteobacteria bacterium RIFOXYD2_FULL_50_16]|uniref:UDP-N-acetylglucosamine 2-epimerase n=1 Tax=Candidatus Lambdaproteobacteria bacterium RIFOXYD2_FULL_50_16 TaxID=1817772 RepID=A0A1F6GD64_9PROT|nr:MAG: UDP-N-acetylglucosamine 2-epimerase [Candidatus Lambdaproteobacteria bacterium RIFOXYD2_FULL_50_16]